MNTRTEKLISNFSFNELRRILMYAQLYLSQNFEPNDNTLQGSILERINQTIKDSLK